MRLFDLSFISYAILLLLISVFSAKLSGKFHNPLLQFTNRWIMRLSICVFISLILIAISTYQRPFCIVLLSVFLSYFLIESMYIWLMIKRFSQLHFPLFPRFSAESETIVWPIDERSQNIREIIQNAGFKFSETLSIKAAYISILISPIFYNKSGNIRLQVMFPNVKKKHTAISFVLTTYLRNGLILVTHNLQSPISLFFSKPFISKLKKTNSIEVLIKYHKKLIKKHLKNALILSGEDCLQAVNNERELLENTNISNGNCEKSTESNYVSLSFIGRYKLWSRTLKLTYFGK